MKLRLLLSFLLLFGLLGGSVGCGDSNCTRREGLGALGDCSSGGPGDGDGGAEGQGLLYVANAQTSSILRFDRATTLEGDLAPVAIIQGGLTRLSAPQYLFLDVANDRLYVANAGQSSILVFDNASTLEGDIPPTRFLEGANTTLSGPAATVLDIGRDLLYVSNTGRAGLLTFGSGATVEADVAPLRTLEGANPGFQNNTDLFLDSAADRMFVANTGAGAISVFDSFSTLSGNVFANRVLRGANTRLSTPTAVLVDLADNLLVADSNSLLRFASASTIDADAAPTAILTGPNTGIRQPGQMLLQSGNLYLANTGSNEILIFNDIASIEGNQFPSRRLGGANSGLLGPSGIALDLSR
ncbi:hypothetical protein DYH09_06610 [bacterium CPR1]|nr:hypothetical protein [bacterium CPR1]